MRPSVMYTPCATSSKEKTGNIITLAQFEKGNILTKTRNDAEILEESDIDTNMMSKQDVDAMNSGDDSDHGFISKDIFEDIRDGIQTYPNVNRREALYKIRDHIRQRKLEWNGSLKATKIM